ncbi:MULTISPECIES: hypothetical protein [unclassified Xanthomonas]|uniref:hypothetical protein n=1 Tax=unclassified Xanthomonas TaxID=2643310 RepID=UPI002A80B5CD|nr:MULTISPECIES: hypothetical protein [unclassified Xanthomonas]MDY4296811.1 hypothetical protein [Xanthomonas sp. LF02-5]MDY4358430.1 hypothetical protein [Xanthomonas sp. LF04-12]
MQEIQQLRAEVEALRTRLDVAHGRINALIQVVTQLVLDRENSTTQLMVNLAAAIERTEADILQLPMSETEADHYRRTAHPFVEYLNAVRLGLQLPSADGRPSGPD